MLKRVPPRMMPTVTTLGSSGLRLRERMVWNAVTAWDAITTGSTLRWGAAPWACLPFTRILKWSTAASAGPTENPTWPTSMSAKLCSPKIALGAGSSSTPSATIIRAPPSSPGGGPSSAGWKMNLTAPGSSSRIEASTDATPSCTATWMSCPQAWLTPTSWPRYVVRTVDLKGNGVSSVTGSASMSARTATTGPGRPPRRMPTTPVCATPVRTSSKPSARRWSATSSAVLNSRLPSSGFWWMISRSRTMVSSTWATASSTRAP